MYFKRHTHNGRMSQNSIKLPLFPRQLLSKMMTSTHRPSSKRHQNPDTFQNFDRRPLKIDENTFSIIIIFESTPKENVTQDKRRNEYK